MTAPTSECREAFEKWWIDESKFPGGIGQYEDGEYVNYNSRIAWSAYQAAWNQRAAGAEGVAVAYRYEYMEDFDRQVDFSEGPYLDSWVLAKSAKVTRLFDAPPDAVVTDDFGALLLSRAHMEAAIAQQVGKYVKLSEKSANDILATINAALKESKHG